MSSSPLAEGLFYGIISALVPGLHPMIFGEMGPYQLGVTYGIFTGLSIVLARKGFYHPETAGEGQTPFFDVVKGIIIGILLVPIAIVVYSVELPRMVLFLVLLVGSIVVGIRDLLVFILTGVLGIVSLKLPAPIFSPLASGLFYLFGLWYILRGGREWKGKVEDWKGGVLASFLTGYFPALPPSAWSKILGNGSVTVAAALTPIFSLVALLYGKTRSAMTAFIPFPYEEVLLFVGLTFLLSLLLVLSLGEMMNVEKLVLPKPVGLGIIIGHALFFGIANTLLLLASLGIVLKSKNDPVPLFGYIILPTMLYYA